MSSSVYAPVASLPNSNTPATAYSAIPSTCFSHTPAKSCATSTTSISAFPSFEARCKDGKAPTSTPSTKCDSQRDQIRSSRMGHSVLMVHDHAKHLQHLSLRISQQESNSHNENGNTVSGDPLPALRHLSSMISYAIDDMERQMYAAAGVKPCTIAPKITHAKSRRRVAGAATGIDISCVKCSASSTPIWRRGPDGRKNLCNVCGLVYARRARKTERG